MGVMAASAPPQIMATASPRWMILNESPMACAPVVQAVATAELGPLAPVRMEMWPLAKLTMAAGMKNGEILDGPPSRYFLCSRSIASKPPMPLPMKTPISSAFEGSIFNPAIDNASSLAAMANIMKRASFLISFFSIHRPGSKSFTSPANRQANSLASNKVMGAIPDRPARRPSQVCSVPIPRPDTSPMPVTTTLRWCVSDNAISPPLESGRVAADGPS